MSDIQAIEIRCEVRQIKTLVDHSVSVTINLPEDCLEQAKVLMDWQGEEIYAILSNNQITSRKQDERIGQGRLSKRKIGESERST